MVLLQKVFDLKHQSLQNYFNHYYYIVMLGDFQQKKGKDIDIFHTYISVMFIYRLYIV